jgi:hypothetical protein
MILNISKIKTEALLLFCRDLINTYKDIKPKSKADLELYYEFELINSEILKQFSNILYEPKYYMENQKSFRVRAILKCYNFISKELEKNLKENEEFNPSLLYFSLLALWFKELNKESTSKEFIFFTLYPYSAIYDKFLIKMSDIEYKIMNIKMIDLSEKIVAKYDRLAL